MAVVAGLAAVQNGVNQAVLPRLARHFLRNLGQFWKLLGGILSLSWLALAAILALVWLQGHNILLVLYGEEYARFDRLFLLVVFAGALVLTGMALGDAVIACHRFKSRTAAVACGLGANALVCWLFVGKYGLVAAAWAAAVAGAVICLYCTAVLLLASRNRTSLGIDVQAGPQP
jgi:O-antigen/teichoic acid export membrane protein